MDNNLIILPLYPDIDIWVKPDENIGFIFKTNNETCNVANIEHEEND